ncbi:MAG: ribonuclease III [Chloroflexi bacterium]|nr:ribonuclease III [Chloroflexota bacterium]
MSDFDTIEHHLQYQFADRTLLERAVTHRSFLNENPEYSIGHNERLEFLGDAVLELLASTLLFQRFPDYLEGNLTRMRGWMVRTETLAGFARRLELGSVLRMARGEEDTGGRERASILCDSFEALIGALYLDGGLETVHRFIQPFFEEAIEDILASQKDKDPKSLFQEWSQAMFTITPIYRLVAATGDENDRVFTVELTLNDIPVAWGSSHRKQLAEQDAARRALSDVRAGVLPIAHVTALTSG